MTKTDYKKLYKMYFPIDWDTKKYEIHHIDGNRKNNEIKNLVLLPKRLHNELHKTRFKIGMIESDGLLKYDDFSCSCFMDEISYFLTLKCWVFNFIGIRNVFINGLYDFTLYLNEIKNLEKRMEECL